MTTHTVEKLLTQDQAAELYSVHICTLIRARRTGELRAVKFGRAVRYRPSDLARWADLNTVDGDQ